MGKQTLLGSVSGEIPWRAGCGIKVIVPVLVESVVGVGYGVYQPIVQHLWGSCIAREHSQHGYEGSGETGTAPWHICCKV